MFRPRIIPLRGGGYQRGPHIYTEEEFQDIFVLGLKTKSLKKKWQVFVVIGFMGNRLVTGL